MIYHSSEINEVLNSFQVDKDTGLLTDDATMRFAEHGANIPKMSRRTSFSKIANTYIKNPCNAILIISVVISIIVNLVYETPFPFAPLLIILMLIFNIALTVGFIKKSENIKNSLECMNIPNVKVLRDGVLRYVNSAYIVPGDILILECGDYVCADGRIIESQDFRCDESFVTGETITAEKNHLDILDDITPIDKRTNSVFCGSNVITGSAKIIVTETGRHTEIGKANKLLHVLNTNDDKAKEKIASIRKTSSVILALFFIIAFLTNVIINFRVEGVDFAVVLSESLINSAVLLISAIPLALSVIRVLALHLCAKSLFQKGILIKNLSVIDTLTDVSVICTDKTGMLTMDNMVAEKVYNGKKILDIKNAYEDKSAVATLRLAALCTSQSPSDIDCPMYNDATELAIINAYNSSVVPEERDIYNNYPLLSKIPFDNEHKVTVTVNMIDTVPYAIIKGAPDFIIKACDCEENKEINETVNTFAESGMRVIAVAYKQLSEIPSNPEISDFMTDMTFAGIIALNDTPQSESIQLINTCKCCGIKTVMVTGDHVATARAVAIKMGIMTDDNQLISGEQLDTLSDDELKDSINNYTVFAKLLPDQKTRIVNAFKANGMTVAITGDSTNDAPALDAADVGIAMGNKGTDVARGAADIILNNNCFSVIISAIKSAKGYFLSIRKLIAFMISSNLGKLLAILLCLFVHKTFPIEPANYLLIMLLADFFPAVSLICDNIEDEKISLKQNNSVKTLTNPLSLILTTVQTLAMATVSIIAFSAFDKGATMMFAVIIFAQIFNMASIKFDNLFYKSAHLHSIVANLVLVAIVLLAVIFATSDIAADLHLISLNFSELLTAILLSFTVFASGELTKLGFMIYKKSK